jgi:hypothetical protein
MKKLIIVIVLACSIHAGLAQDSLKMISGNWVVESNIRTPKEQLVKFYNSRLELIYQENVLGKKLRIEKERVRKALDKTLLLVLKNGRQVEPGILSAMMSKKNFR